MKRHLTIAVMIVVIALFSGCTFLTNDSDEVKKEDILAIGSPLDETGSILHADQLFDRPCVYQEFVSVTADPNRPNSYLYTFRFFYCGDGSEYHSEGEETTLLTIHNCRRVHLFDYDNDGIVELFVQTESDEESFMLYDMENGEITSGILDEIPSTARGSRTMVVAKDTFMRNCFSYTYSNPMDNDTYEWYWIETEHQLTEGSVVLVLGEMNGMSCVMIPYGDIPRIYGFLDSSLLRDDIHLSKQATIVYSGPGFAAPGDDTPVTTLLPCTVQLLETHGEWVKVQPLGNGEDPCWVESSHLQVGYFSVTDYEVSVQPTATPEPESTPETTPEPTPVPEKLTETPPTEQVYSEDPGWVLLTLADGTQREGWSSPDDVEVEIVPKGGWWLHFHVAEEELEWASTVEFQKATVRFGGSMWEHPGDVSFNSEYKVFDFRPTASGMLASYRDYGREIQRFRDLAKDDAAATPNPTPEPTPEPTSETCAPKNTRLYVLMYHHFVPDGTECNPWTLTASRFREDLQWLSDNGYTTVLPGELAAGMELPEKAVMITLDDGYASNYDIAFSLLKEFNAKAVISLITSTLERTLTWDQCREMAQSGLVEFGSHTHAVHNTFSGGIQRLPDESQTDYEARVFPDIMTSIELIEQNLSTKVQMFAYPYGKTDEWADQFMKDTFAVTVNSVSATASIKNDLYDLPRYNITMDTPLSMYLE